MEISENTLLLREQTRQLFHNAPSSALTQISVAALFYILFNNALNSQLLALWCSSIFRDYY